MSLGFFDWFGGGDSNYDVGKEVLMAYFDEASNFSEFTFSSFEAWESWLNSRVPDLVAFVGELVKSNVAATTVGQAADRVANLANQSAGQATIPEIIKAAGGSGDTVNWWAGVPEVASGIAEDTVEVFQEVGEGVIGSLKYMPLIIAGVAIVGAWAYFSSVGSKHGAATGAIAGAAHSLRKKS